MDIKSKIYIAGHRGLVGSALIDALKAQGYYNLIYRTREELDLRDPRAVHLFFKEYQPDYVFLSAAQVGGIWANQTFPANFLYNNLMISANVIHAAYESQVQKLIYLGSSCIYPKLAPQPLKEESLLTGPLEPTNEPYALAKIAGVKLCEAYQRQFGCRFVSAMPTNLYGPSDRFIQEYSHVIPGMMQKFHEAQVKNSHSVRLWGTGKPLREFLYVEDLANALILLMEKYEGTTPINIGSGIEVRVSELAEQIAEIVGYRKTVIWDSSMPDGTPRKILNSEKIHSLGWTPKWSLKEGLTQTYKGYVQSL